jgi:hypothetical protein
MKKLLIIYLVLLSSIAYGMSKNTTVTDSKIDTRIEQKFNDIFIPKMETEINDQVKQLLADINILLDEKLKTNFYEEIKPFFETNSNEIKSEIKDILSHKLKFDNSGNSRKEVDKLYFYFDGEDRLIFTDKEYPEGNYIYTTHFIKPFIKDNIITFYAYEEKEYNPQKSDLHRKRKIIKWIKEVSGHSIKTVFAKYNRNTGGLIITNAYSKNVENNIIEEP